MTMRIKILGPGCRNCVTLDRVTGDAVTALALDATVEKVENYQAIMDDSVMTTPALVVDDQVLLAGRVPAPSVLRQLLADASDRHTQTQNTIEGTRP